MPEERGSIYKSTANEIGEALKAKLGGEGFAPKDWSKNLNLLGIAPEDTEAAINSLKESEGSGERGSILLSTANAIGSMLNKKYNSQRGFSPAEWASATRKMKALETDTKSGGIVNLKGAKEVPITSLVGTINPTLEGTDTLVATRLGKNLLENTLTSQTLNGTTFTINSDKTITISGTPSTQTRVYIHSGEFYKVKAVSYFSCGSMPNGTRIFCQKVSSGGSSSYPTISPSTTLDDIGATYNNMLLEINTTFDGTPFTIQPMLEVGSSATAYTPYVAPTTYTANLGRTIYGGSGDIVKGEGVDSGNTFTVVNNTDWDASIRYIGSGDTAYIQINHLPVSNNRWQDLACSHFTPANIYAGGTAQGIGCYGSQFYIRDSRFTSKQDFMDFLTEQEGLNTPLKITYTVNQPTAFTFDPIPINTSGDTENFYTSHGDTSITYYEEPTAYTRGTASGMIASIPEANTEFPFTKLKSTIAPSVDGKDTVEVYNYGKNLFNKEEPNVVNGYINTTGTKFTSGDNWRTLFLPVVSGATYTVSRTPGHSFRVATSQVPPTNNALYISTIANHTGTSITVTIDSNAKYLWVFFWASSNDPDITPEEIIPTIQIEAGSEATTFEEYKQPTTYTAELGETVYGGSVDFVSGEVIGNERKTVLDNSGWTYYPVSGANTFNKIIPLAKVGGSGILDGYDFQNVQHISQQPDKTFFFYAAGTNARISIRDDSYTNASDFAAAINNKVLLFELATPTEASIEPQEIYPREGVNNIWNDANGITEVGYFGD